MTKQLSPRQTQFNAAMHADMVQQYKKTFYHWGDRKIQDWTLGMDSSHALVDTSCPHLDLQMSGFHCHFNL